MGATISCNKKIGAFVRSNGDRIYIMFEQTYESNCHPHHPNWCAMQMGSLDNVMRGIFLIRALRAKLKESVQFLPTCVVLINDVSDSMYDYQADSLRRLAKVLGQSLPCRIPVADVVAAGCADWHVRWDVESLAEQGFLRIETPEGAANLAIAVSVPTAKAGMEIVHSGSAYLLDERISRGWRVTRRSDGTPFRMTLSQVDEAVRATHPVQYQPMMTQASPPVAMSLF